MAAGDRLDVSATFFDMTGRKVGGFKLALTATEVAGVLGRWEHKLAPPSNVVRVTLDVALPMNPPDRTFPKAA